MGMGEAVIVALISGGISLFGTVLTVLATSRKTAQEMKTSQAVMDTKIEELTREVREHNNFARRMPVVEEKIETLKGRMDGIEDRIRQ